MACMYSIYSKCTHTIAFNHIYPYCQHILTSCRAPIHSSASSAVLAVSLSVVLRACRLKVKGPAQRRPNRDNLAPIITVNEGVILHIPSDESVSS